MFLILIAVALFAALSYAVTSSSRGGGSVQNEKDLLLRAQITQFGGELRQAILRLKLAGQCTDESLSFDSHNNTSSKGNGTIYDYNNPFSPGDGSCGVFTKEGGNVSPRRIPAELVIPAAPCPACMTPDSWLVTATRVLGNGSDAADSSGSDLVLWLGRLTREQCLAVNRELGITNPGGEPPVESFDCQGPQFQGIYSACAEPIGNDIAELAGKQEFCFDWGGGAAGGYLYMQVLLGR